MNNSSTLRGYIFRRTFFPALVITTLVSLFFIILGTRMIYKSSGNVVNTMNELISDTIVSYLVGILPFEKNIEDSIEILLDWMKYLYSENDFQERFEYFVKVHEKVLSDEDVAGIDYLIFDSVGNVIVGNPIATFHVDRYTINFLSKLSIGEIVFEKLEKINHIYEFGEVFEKRGFVRLGEDRFGVVRYFIKFGANDFLKKIKDISRRRGTIDSVSIYDFDLNPFGELFPPLDHNLRSIAEEVMEKGAVKEIRKFNRFTFISRIDIPAGERRFSKPLIAITVINLSKLFKMVTIFLAIVIITSALIMSFFYMIILKVSNEVSRYTNELIDMMNTFREKKIFIPPEDVVESNIAEIKKIFLHFFELSEDLTAHIEELEAAGEELEKAYAELEKSYETIERAHLKFAQKLAMIAEGYDETTGNHIARVGELSAFIALKLRMGEEFVERIRIYAQLHDIGKILIPHEILNKPGKLTEEEFETMKKHTIYGELFLKDIEKFEMAKNIALYHHEKYDGSGYPFGLKGESIPVEARIVAVVDVYDALRSKRPYKPAFSHEKALKIILEGDGRTYPEHFDPDVLEIFRKFSEDIERLWNSIVSMETELERELKEILEKT